MKIDALLDSNVLVAAVADNHVHHRASLALLNLHTLRLAVGSHSFAEAYNALTRTGPLMFDLTPRHAWAGLESIRAVTALIGLTAPQTLDAIKAYAERGGIGPRLYDHLIGEAAVAHGIPVIATWNIRHMRGLFPTLRVETPDEYLQSRV